MPISFMGNYLRSRHYTGKLIHCFATCGQIGKRRELRVDFKFWSRHFCKGERNNCADICLADPVATCEPAFVGFRRALIEEAEAPQCLFFVMFDPRFVDLLLLTIDP